MSPPLANIRLKNLTSDRRDYCLGLYDGLPVRRMLAWDSPRVAKQLLKKARGEARVRIELIRTLEELLATEHAGSKKE